jgi:hypothetical protein
MNNFYKITKTLIVLTSSILSILLVTFMLVNLTKAPVTPDKVYKLVNTNPLHIFGPTGTLYLPTNLTDEKKLDKQRKYKKEIQEAKKKQIEFYSDPLANFIRSNLVNYLCLPLLFSCIFIFIPWVWKRTEKQWIDTYHKNIKPQHRVSLLCIPSYLTFVTLQILFFSLIYMSTELYRLTYTWYLLPATVLASSFLFLFIDILLHSKMALTLPRSCINKIQLTAYTFVSSFLIFSMMLVVIVVLKMLIYYTVDFYSYKSFLIVLLVCCYALKLSKTTLLSGIFFTALVFIASLLQPTLFG